MTATAADDESSDTGSAAADFGDTRYNHSPAPLRGATNFFLMTDTQKLKKALHQIESDERLHYAAASVQINAPLALIQVALKERAIGIRIAMQTLGITPPPPVKFHTQKR